MRKMIIIGLDGATWNLLEGLIKEGGMPTLEGLMKNGVYGNLESSIPPVTGPAWVSFATGKNPGKHGIYDFIIPEDSLTKVKTITSGSIKGKTFYEILESENISCILINLPCSFPPKTDNITITSLMTKGDNWIFPHNLKKDIPELEHYRITPDMTLLKSGEEHKYIEYVNDIRNLEKNRFEVAKKLFIEKSWDVFFILFSGTDWVQHILFDKIVSRSLSKNHPAFFLYKDIDRYLKFFVESLPKETTLIIMSDHGFCSYSGKFYINEWMESRGYLKLKMGSGDRVYRHRFMEESSKAETAKKIKLRPPRSMLKVGLALNFDRIYKKLIKYLPFTLRIDMKPDVSKSAAYCLTTESLGIYINSNNRFKDGIINDNEYKEIRDEILGELKGLKNDGENVVINAWRREKMYYGPQIDKAPDIIYMPQTHWPSLSTATSKILGNQPLNNHSLQGIFLAYSEEIKENERIENIKIYDIAPTIFHIFDLPIPKDMDGRVLREIFREDCELFKRQVSYREIGEKEEIEKKIKELKNLGRI